MFEGRCRGLFSNINLFTSVEGKRNVAKKADSQKQIYFSELEAAKFLVLKYVICNYV
jgi:hypothetical protein